MALGKDIHTETRLKDDLIISSDDEKGLTKALHAVFNTATHLLCTKHLKDNLTAYMEHKDGVTQKERIKIVQQLFSQDGLNNADDTVDPSMKETKNSGLN